mgnify:CR=1 FL=1
MRKGLLTILAFGLLFSAGCSSANEKRTFTEEGKTEVTVQETLLETQNRQIAEITAQLQGGTLDNPIVLVNPYGISPLSALIQFDTETAEPVTVIVKGKQPQTDLTWTYEPSTSHCLPIIGLYPEQKTTVQLIVDDMVKELEIEGQALPENAFMAEVTIEHQNPQPNQLIFTTPSSTGYATGYDSQGEIRWILNVMMLWDLNLLEDGRITLSTNRLLDSPYYTTGFLTMDLLGHIDAEYSVPGGYHHDLDQLPNGNFLIASDDFNGSTVEDVIVEVDRQTGEVVKSFDLKTILPQDQGKSLNWTAKDWFHNNSVDYNPAQNTLTVSGRHQDAVAVIDYDTQELIAIIGSPDGWPEEMQKYFLTPAGENFEWQWAQHAATWLDEKRLMLFDNGMYRSKTEDKTVAAENNYSRLVVYEVDLENKTIRQVKEYGKERGYTYYSPYISDVDFLGKDQWLITSGGISWLDGKINNMPGSLTTYDQMEAYVTLIEGDQEMFELKIPANIYRAEMMDVSKTTLTPLKSGSLLGSLGVTTFKTEADLSSKLKFSEAQRVDEELAKKLILTQEQDRLMVTATLNKHDNLDLILVNEKELRVYPVQTDTQPGMCVAVFNQPKSPDVSTLIQTISAEGLDGTWHIYYLFNQQLYDASQVYKN